MPIGSDYYGKVTTTETVMKQDEHTERANALFNELGLDEERRKKLAGLAHLSDLASDMSRPDTFLSSQSDTMPPKTPEEDDA